LDAYKGPGVWHTVTGRFLAPKFDADGKKVRGAEFQQIMVDGVMVVGSAEPNGQTGGGAAGEVARGPLRFQGTLGQVCLGDVRIKPLDGADPGELDGATDWIPLFGSGTEGWESSGSAEWTFTDGVLQAQNGPGSLRVRGEPVSAFEMECRLRVAEGGSSSLAFLGDGKGRAVRLALNANPGGQPKTGSILDQGEGTITTDLIPGGAWFELRVVSERLETGTHARVYLNGVLFQDQLLPIGAGMQGFAIELGDGATLEMSDARVRFVQ
jgi:hypothetical protein